MARSHEDEPILITQAAPSFEEEFAARKRRYTRIMAFRIPCLVIAGIFAIGFDLPLVGVIFIVLSVPLPWIAVLIANDRPPKKAEKVSRYRKEPTRLEAVGDRQIIEAAQVLDARGRAGDEREVPPDIRDARGRQERSDGADDPPRRTGTEG